MNKLFRNKFTSDIKYTGGDIINLFDNTIKECYVINDDEYDYIATECTDDELDTLLNDEKTFSIKRYCCKFIEDRLVDYYNKLIDDLPPVEKTKFSDYLLMYKSYNSDGCMVCKKFNDNQEYRTYRACRYREFIYNTNITTV